MRSAMHETHLVAMSDTGRGEAIARRINALGISDREFHEQSGIDRKTLRRAISGQENVRPSTYAAIESALAQLEQRIRPPGLQGNEEGLVTFRLSGNFGVEVTVQGPVTNLSELEASVEKLLRGMRKEEEQKRRQSDSDD